MASLLLRSLGLVARYRRVMQHRGHKKAVVSGAHASTDVPNNWHPFIPVHVPGNQRSVQLQRARMPGPARTTYGQILKVPSPCYINEEEAPRTGRGEGSSGLAFDQVIDARGDRT
jgi:hypothetical protein